MPAVQEGAAVIPYYTDDLVTIYHGDCREWMPEADVIVTDPPYGVRWSVGGVNDWHRGNARRAMRGDAFDPLVGDDRPFDPSGLLALGLPTVLFGANHYADRLPPSATWLVWDKRTPGYTNDQADVELAWSNLGGPARIFHKSWSGGGTLARENGTARRTVHPTQKPADLMRWVIGRCPPGTILDPFMGSGTTLVAAKSLNRHAIGIEIEERYCEVAAKRCAQEVLGLVG